DAPGGNLDYDDDEDGPYKPLSRPSAFAQGMPGASLPPKPEIGFGQQRGGFNQERRGGSRGGRGDIRGRNQPGGSRGGSRAPNYTFNYQAWTQAQSQQYQYGQDAARPQPSRPAPTSYPPTPTMPTWPAAGAQGAQAPSAGTFANPPFYAAAQYAQLHQQPGQ